MADNNTEANEALVNVNGTTNSPVPNAEEAETKNGEAQESPDAPEAKMKDTSQTLDNGASEKPAPETTAKCEAENDMEDDSKDAEEVVESLLNESNKEDQDVPMADAPSEKETPKAQEEAFSAGDKKGEVQQDEINKDPHVGKVLERTKVLPSGQFYPLQGKVVSYQAPSGRLPPRWRVHWETAEDVVLADESVAADLEVDALEVGNGKFVVDQIQARSQQHVEHVLESNNLVASLLLYAAMEEALQTNLQYQQETPSAKGSSPHPPLYYGANPSSYLQAPTATDTTASLNVRRVHVTPANLAQRVRTGCQWAWNYLAAQQPPAPAPFVSLTHRRSLRQPKASTGPAVPKPTPVQRGGRVAMWWLAELENQAHMKLEAESNKKLAKKEVVPQKSPKNDKPPKKEKAEETNEETKQNGQPKTVEEIESIPDEPLEDDTESDAKNDDDEDYSSKDAEEEDEEDLEDVERERKGNLSPVSERTDEEGGEEGDSEEEDEDEDNAILYENPYLQPSFPAFLEHLARPKALSGEDVQTALCEAILRIKFNKRSAEHGLATTELISVDQVVLNQETPDYPPGKVVLKCVSGESYSELSKLDPQVFSRCKFTLDVIGEQETSQQVQRKQELLLQEAQFKDRKAWDKWRFRSIHEGYTTWPSWQDAITEWVQANVTAETAIAESTDTKSEDAKDDEAKDDEALAKSLEETEQGGRRRTKRRAATSGGSEGVFYGNQSQLTQKQLMDALVRLIRATQFQTMIRLQDLVADDSNDPIRRSRIALGKLVWKRNQLMRKSVTADLSDDKLTKTLAQKPLLSIQPPVPPEGEKEETEIRELSKEEEGLVHYVASLHSIELQLRRLVLKNLAEIPVAIVATAADERAGSTEAMDDADFEDTSSIEWLTSGHDLINKLIFRPAETKSTTDLSECYWYKIQEYSKSIESEGEDKEEPNSMERRMRFRALWVPEPEESLNTEKDDSLILTEAQIHAGLKAAELEQQQTTGPKSDGNPFAGGSGDKVTLIAVDMDEMDDSQAAPSEIHGTIVGYENVIDEDDGSVEYRILILPDGGKEEAFWAALDVRADDSSYVCQPVGESTTWYSIEQFDYHPGSEAFKECMNVVNYLRRQSKIGPFSEPVDPVALNIPTYFKIVKNPMDLSTLADKLENGHYSSIPPGQTIGNAPAARMLNGPFKKDVELMFENAMIFNPPDDWIYIAANQLKKSALKKIVDLSYAADQKLSGAGTGRFRKQKKSVYVDEDSDVDMYEYESDQDEEFDGGGRRSRKRKRGARGGANKDDFSSRAVEHAIRLQQTLRDAADLRGPFANLPLNLTASSFSLPEGWSCRPATVTEITKDKADASSEARAQELAELIALQKVVEENESAGRRRSTRAQHEPSTSGSSSKSRKGVLEYFLKEGTPGEPMLVLPSSRVDVEVQDEKCHEEYYSKLYQTYASMMTPQEASESFGVYSNGSFPPFLGRAVPISSSTEVSWEIRAPFVVPALRWVLRGLIQSGHLTALEPMTADASSGVLMTNDIYYWDASLKPFEVLDLRELQRKKRANKPDDVDSEEDIELSEYEQARATRVARNAERLKALGLA